MYKHLGSLLTLPRQPGSKDQLCCLEMLAMPCRELFSLSLLCRTTLSNKSYSPYLGQGVAQAVEDAIAITTVLSLIKSKQQLPEALQAYETSRKTRVLEMQAATRQAQQ